MLWRPKQSLQTAVRHSRLDREPRNHKKKLEPSSFSDVAFGKVATHNFLGRDVEKDMEYHGKNFPVNKA